ncbi:MAG TPA: D-aminoacyl-tRNA deacylase [Saprospiraceae bacterium]|nr:D-aminoacyl-tRNA deacylase [Saprospiraceae bacterium]
MRAVIQRVTSAKITINHTIERHIGPGFLVLLGIEEEDDIEDVKWLSQKVLNMRIFSDQDGKMNLGLNEVNGDILLVSQFTLFASTRKGNRPSFIKSAKPLHAIPLYEAFIKELTVNISDKQNLQTGEFGADMQITLTNDGPVTIIIDSKIKE